MASTVKYDSGDKDEGPSCCFRIMRSGGNGHEPRNLNQTRQT